MNKARRKVLQEIYNIISDAKDDLEVVFDEEEEYKENIPENLQNSERYEKAEEATDNISLALSSLEEALDYINDIL